MIQSTVSQDELGDQKADAIEFLSSTAIPSTFVSINTVGAAQVFDETTQTEVFHVPGLSEMVPGIREKILPVNTFPQALETFNLLTWRVVVRFVIPGACALPRLYR